MNTLPLPYDTGPHDDTPIRPQLRSCLVDPYRVRRPFRNARFRPHW